MNIVDMTDRPSTVPPYVCQGHEFSCWITPDGYVWRSGEIEVGRLGRNHWCRVSGQIVGTDYVSLQIAMRRGVTVAGRRQAA